MARERATSVDRVLGCADLGVNVASLDEDEVSEILAKIMECVARHLRDPLPESYFRKLDDLQNGRLGYRRIRRTPVITGVPPELHEDLVPGVRLMEVATVSYNNISPVSDEPPTGCRRVVLLLSNAGGWYLWAAEYRFDKKWDEDGPDFTTIEEAVSSEIRALTQAEVVAYILEQPKLLREIAGQFGSLLQYAGRQTRLMADGQQRDGGLLAAMDSRMKVE